MKEKVAYLIFCIMVFAAYMYWLFSKNVLNPLIPVKAAIAILALCFIAFIALIAWLIFFQEIQKWKQRKKA